jgi:DNA-binding transcriptional regulator YiaG
MKKYQSKIARVIHNDAMAMFRAGAISEVRMREYDEMCLVQPPAMIVPRVATQKAAPAFTCSSIPVHTRGK